MENRECPTINAYCYVCGHLVPKSDGKERKKLFSVEFKLAYTRYFDEVDLSGEDFTPDTVCMGCYCNLLNWLHRRRTKLHFIKPVIWLKDPNGHDASRCYACINYDPTFNKKRSKAKEYVAAFTASLPVPFYAGAEPPVPPSPETVSLLTGGGFTDARDPDWIPEVGNDEPKPLSQSEMDYLVAKLGLSQRNSEMLTSFLKRRKLTKQDVKATGYRKRQAEYQKLYTVNDENTFTYCNDIEGLVNKLGIEYIAGDWRLFIDGSVSSLKAVLLHKTNKQPSIPLAFGTHMKETYETLGSILKEIKYHEHKWKICCDLKVVNILQGVIAKGGFPKFFCFLCNWDSRSKIDHYQCHDWIRRTPENEKKLNLCNEPLIRNIDDILLPPLHIKLGIASKFIQVAVEDAEEVYGCLQDIFPKLSTDKIKKGIFIYLHT